jgi:hypothetical protein
MSPAQQFELRCSDVHPNGCHKLVCGHDMLEVMVDVQLHGELRHGYTPAFYETAWPRMRLALIEQAR